MLNLTIQTEIIIQASASQVWEVLTNFEAYPSWNPFIRSISGDLQTGSRLNVEICPTHAKRMRFRPTIQHLDAERSLVWLGHFLVPHVLDGEHRFELHSLADGSTRLKHAETFHGVFIPLMRKQLSLIEQDFMAMNHALKVRVEAL